MNNNIDFNIITISADNFNNCIKSYNFYESIEISTKSSSSKNNNILEQFEDFENNIINEEKDKLIEYYENFYNI